MTKNMYHTAAPELQPRPMTSAEQAVLQVQAILSATPTRTEQKTIEKVFG